MEPSKKTPPAATSSRRSSAGSHHRLSPETIKRLEKLCAILKPIYLRMRQEGYELKDGIITKPYDHEAETKT